MEDVTCQKSNYGVGKVFSKKRGKTKELKPIKKGRGGYVKVRLC